MDEPKELSKYYDKTDTRLNRRDFLRLGVASTAVGALTIANAPNKVTAQINREIKREAIEKNVGLFIETHADYKPFYQKNNVFGGLLTGRRPDLIPKLMKFMDKLVDKNRPGYTQIDEALAKAGFIVANEIAPTSMFGIPNKGFHAWEQRTKYQKKEVFDDNIVSDIKYEFTSKGEASSVVKRAARFFGADLIGIAIRDKRWDYAEFIDLFTGKTFGWQDFPFEPRSVIVMGFEMNYEAYATAPSLITEGATGDAYSRMSKTAFQVSVFLKNLGYRAVAAGNDMGLSVPYAAAAGLGEPSRMGIIISPRFGPRFRIAKVYTDLAFLEYDRPIKFGVQEFCERCLRCAHACPAKAITREPKPTFEPTYAHSEKWFNNPGTKKYYNDSLSCFEYWLEIRSDCGVCVTCCPYNKQDYWQHRLVHKLTEVMPGQMDSFLRSVDNIFGYGNTFDERASKTFWDSSNREYLGY
jgi:epoxyqueuosine reductase